MAALLKLNEAGRIQDLIEQNMALAKNLREANEKVDRLNRESNADKDAITDALRDLAIAKSQINRLHQDKREQDKRLAELETRLKNEEAALCQRPGRRRSRRSRSPARHHQTPTPRPGTPPPGARPASRGRQGPRQPRTNASPRPSSFSTPRKSRSPRKNRNSSPTSRWMASSSPPSPGTAPPSAKPPRN